MICCMPSTSSLMKSVQGPMRSWLSNASERAFRLTGSSRNGMPRSGAGSQSNLKGSLESNRNALHSYPAPRDGHTAWAGTNPDTYPLRQMFSNSGGVWKKTEIQISHADLERTEYGCNNFNVVAIEADQARKKKAQQMESDDFDIDSLYIQE